MKTKILFVLLTAAVFLIGCSSESDKKAKNESLVDVVIDDVVDSTLKAPADTEEAPTVSEADQESTFAVTTESYPAVYDFVVKDDAIYGLVDNGVLVHKVDDGSNKVIPADLPLNAIVDLGDRILVGSDRLLVINDDYLSDAAMELNTDARITVLTRYGLRLLIGTADGLYMADADGIRVLAEGIVVSALAVSPDGVWVGTHGNGLYLWDGAEFNKRFLTRDTTLFDFVTALDFQHNHLYLGTDRGLFVFDGGRWDSYTLGNGLPSDSITTIDARDWTVRIGTANGAVTLFDGNIELMGHMEDKVVTRFTRIGKNLYTATLTSGLLVKSGGIVTPLYEGDSQPEVAVTWDTW